MEKIKDSKKEEKQQSDSTSSIDPYDTNNNSTTSDSSDLVEEIKVEDCYFECALLIKQQVLNLYSLSYKYLQSNMIKWAQSIKNNDLKKNGTAFWYYKLSNYEKVLASFLSEWETWFKCDDCKLITKRKTNCDHPKLCKLKLKDPLETQNIQMSWNYYYTVGSEYINPLIDQIRNSKRNQWCKNHWDSNHLLVFKKDLEDKLESLKTLSEFFDSFVQESK